MSVQCLEEQAVDAVVPAATLPPSMVERMTLILDSFRGPGDHLMLEQIARATHLPRSTAHRILDQLVRLGWLDHTTRGYSLGQRALLLGGDTDLSTSDLRAAAAPVLHELAMRTGLVVHLAVLDGTHVRYLDKVGGSAARAVPSRVGGLAPAHCTALGKAMLAWLSAEDVDAASDGVLVGGTPHSIGDLAALHRELHQVRGRNGLAFERGEFVEGLACCAAAVRGPHGPVAAISLVGSGGVPLERVAPLVVRAARHISSELYGEIEPPSSRRRARGRHGARALAPVG